MSYYREYTPWVFDPTTPPRHLQENYTHTLNQSCNLQSSKTYHNLQKNTPWPPWDKVNDLHKNGAGVGEGFKNLGQRTDEFQNQELHLLTSTEWFSLTYTYQCFSDRL